MAMLSPLPPSWVVLKFGGTSVSTATRWRCIADQIQSHLDEKDEESETSTPRGKTHVWVTISAMTQVTNKLTSAITLASRGNENDSHIESVKSIVLQHFDLAYDVGLFPHTFTREEWQQSWLCSVLGRDESSFGNVSIHSTIPTLFYPLLNEFRHLLRILEGIKLTEEASPRIQARVLAFGELLSTHLGLCILQHYGITSVQRVDARDLLRSESTSAKSEEDRYLQADVIPIVQIEKAEAESGGKRVVLTQGFIASTKDTGATCVLGRGGSDTSGALFAAMLQARRYEIWTDVHGMFTSDPRYVPNARLITSLEYREAQELAAMGAKVLHPRCIAPVQWANIPLEIRNTNDPHGPKTTIQQRDLGSSVATDRSFKMLAVVRRANMTTMSITAFTMCGTSGFLSQVFAPFETYGISVDLIATSQFSVTVTLDHIPGGLNGTAFQQLLDALNKLKTTVQVFEECSVVSIVGRKLRTSLASLGRVFHVLEGYDVLLLSESAEDLNLSFVLEQQKADDIVAKMHEYFFSETNCETNGRRRSWLGPTWQNLILAQQS